VDDLGPVFGMMLLLMGLFVFVGVVTVYSAMKGENDCREALSQHGFSFVRYKPQLGGFLSGSAQEECWGEKDGVITRIY